MSLNPQFPQFISVDPYETIRIIKQHQAFETQLLQQLSGSYLVSCFSSWKKLILEKLNYTLASFFEKIWNLWISQFRWHRTPNQTISFWWFWWYSRLCGGLASQLSIAIQGASKVTPPGNSFSGQPGDHCLLVLHKPKTNGLLSGYD